MHGHAPLPLRVLAVDDHPILREGIRALIESQADMRLIAEASNGREALAVFRRVRPNVTLMDLQMPDMNGIDAIKAIRSEFGDARIIVLTTYSGDVRAERALKAGAQAYVLKGLVRKELLETVRAVVGGQRRVHADIAAEIANYSRDTGLTAREIDVLSLVSDGYSNRRVALQLGIHEETVKGYMKNVLAKLGASDRTHAVTLAMRRGIIQL